MSDHEAYSVVWVCVSEQAYIAACAFLPVSDTELPERVTSSGYSYTLGTMSGHNIVIASSFVPYMLLETFPNIRLVLTIGIGGVPPSSEDDIRLGDVVVGIASDGSNSCHEYNMPENRRLDFSLKTIPITLRSAISGIQAKHELNGHQIRQNVEHCVRQSAWLRKFGRRPSSSRCLHRPNAMHTGENCCGDYCDAPGSRGVERSQKDELKADPAIHYGIIASIPDTMTETAVKDPFVTNENVLCFITGPGYLPGLVICGICKNSNSYISGDWQGYAAMTAAAYTKDLLTMISPYFLQAEEPMSTQQHTPLQRPYDKSQQIMRWLKPSDPSINLNKALEQCHPDALWRFIGRVAEKETMVIDHTQDEDIRAYIQARVHQFQACKPLIERLELRDSVVEKVFQKSDGMFRWASYHLDELEKCLDVQGIEKALDELPRTLEGTYTRIFASIPESHRDMVITILRLVTWSDRPLSLIEAMDALATRRGEPGFYPGNRLPIPEEILTMCSGIVVPVQAWTDVEAVRKPRAIQLAHLSVREYLLSTNSLPLYDLHEPWQESNTIRKEIPADPLYYASLGGLFYTASMLITRGASLNLNAGFFGTALGAASARGHERVVEMLLQKKADAALPIRLHGSALHLASASGRSRIVQMLLSHGANVAGLDAYERLPLHCAILGRSLAVVRILLKSGAKDMLDQPDSQRCTALHLALQNGAEVIADYLLDEGASITGPQDKSGKTSIDILKTRLMRIFPDVYEINKALTDSLKEKEFGQASRIEILEISTKKVEVLRSNCNESHEKQEEWRLVQTSPPKIFRKTFCSNIEGDALERLARERSILESLHHPNIVSFLGFDVVDDGQTGERLLHLYMECCEGGDLSHDPESDNFDGDSDEASRDENAQRPALPTPHSHALEQLSLEHAWIATSEPSLTWQSMIDECKSEVFSERPSSLMVLQAAREELRKLTPPTLNDANFHFLTHAAPTLSYIEQTICENFDRYSKLLKISLLRKQQDVDFSHFTHIARRIKTLLYEARPQDVGSFSENDWLLLSSACPKQVALVSPERFGEEDLLTTHSSELAAHSSKLAAHSELAAHFAASIEADQRPKKRSGKGSRAKKTVS
ncbi:hypothetical protein D6D23_07158 [Aureobasidium pullulans]|nr:hypothetical protein D6D23_07158 [Aureobasidium pullulans]